MLDNGPHLRKSQLSDEVAHHLRQRIMSGQLRPGTFIRLDQVAAGLGVSVTPVREALAALRSEDMVRLEPNRGFVVTSIARQDIVDLFDLQAGLAGELAARAATKMSTQDIKRLADIQAEMTEAAKALDTGAMERLEYDFHSEINVAADSRKLSWFLMTAARYLPRHFYSVDADWRKEMLRSHREIVRAIRSSDAEQARAATSAHVLAGKEQLLAHLEAAGLWTTGAEPY